MQRGRIARLSKALNHLGHPGLFVRSIDFDKVEPHNVGRQMFTDGETSMPLMVSAELLETCRKRWKAGDFKCLEMK